MKAMSFKCFGCLYYLGVFKCIICPCMSCQVMGGSNQPITLSHLSKKVRKGIRGSNDG